MEAKGSTQIIVEVNKKGKTIEEPMQQKTGSLRIPIKLTNFSPDWWVKEKREDTSDQYQE